jgi:hypothetical protein
LECDVSVAKNDGWRNAKSQRQQAKPTACRLHYLFIMRISQQHHLIRHAATAIVSLGLGLFAAGCASDSNSLSGAPPARTVSPDDYSGITGSGGVNGTYDRGGALPDGTSGRYGASGSISGGDSGDINEAVQEREAELPRD